MQAAWTYQIDARGAPQDEIVALECLPTRKPYVELRGEAPGDDRFYSNKITTETIELLVFIHQNRLVFIHRNMLFWLSAVEVTCFHSSKSSSVYPYKYVVLKNGLCVSVSV